MVSARRRYWRLRRRLRAFRPAFRGLVLLLVLSGLWVVARGALAARDLQGVQRDLSSLQTAASGDPADSARLTDLVSRLQAGTRKARDRTSDPVWRLWEHAPVVGSSLRLTGGIARQADALSDSVLPPLVAVAHLVPSLRQPGGTIDLRPLERERPALTKASASLADSRRVVRSYRDSWIPPLSTARRKLLSQLDELQTRVDGVTAAATIGPAMLADGGTRRYLIAVQNNAEARASGGIVSAYGVLHVADGRPTLEKFGSDVELPAYDAPVIDLGKEWAQRYVPLGQGQDWREVTATPDFPTAAKVMLALWAKAHDGDRLDGVLSVDPLALADILQATGPITSVDGRVLTSATFVPFTLSEVYADYPDKDRRTEVLTAAAKGVFQALVGGAGKPAVLGERLGNAALLHHLQLYSAHHTEQEVLAAQHVGGALPAAADPLIGVFTQDAGAGKLSYYLRRDVAYVGGLSSERQDYGDGRGPVPQESGTVAVRLTNTAPSSGLPTYVTLREDGPIPPGRPLGQMKVALSLYLGHLGQLESATLNGKTISMDSQTEKGLSVFTTALSLDPGESVTFIAKVSQPTVPHSALTLLQQPLVFPDRLSIRQSGLRAS